MKIRLIFSRYLSKYFRHVAAPGIVFFLLGMIAPSIGAQSLAMAPAQMNYRFKPGQPFQFDLSISNNSDAPTTMRFSATDLWYNEKNEKLFDSPGSSPHSAGNWIEFVPREVDIPANGTGKVQVVITPPLHASGGYYAVVFAESKPELAEAATADKKAVYTNMRLGCLVLLSAEATEDYKITVSGARFTAPAANQAMTLDFLLANDSNTHVFPETKVAILNSSHNVVAKAEGETKRFLPGQKDRLSVPWAGTLPPGEYNALLTIVYGQDKIYTQEFPFSVAPFQGDPISAHRAPGN